MVCSSIQEKSFEKDFKGMWNLNIIEYYTCINCGFTASKTHFEMSMEEWGTLNNNYHGSFFGKKDNPDDPRWMERISHMKDIVVDLSESEVLNSHGKWVDYGCGDGKLASLLRSQGLPCYQTDAYTLSDSKHQIPHEELKLAGYDTVICTCVFEHVRSIDELDFIVSLTSSDGNFALHTLVVEEVPKDEDWFYLLPVHCSFFTNKSMQILFERWGFKSSIYDLTSRMWFLFKKEDFYPNLTYNDKLIYQYSFVDYWK